MSAIDSKLVDIEHRMKVKGFNLTLCERFGGTALVFEKEDVKTLIMRKDFSEMPNDYVEYKVESEFKKALSVTKRAENVQNREYFDGKVILLNSLAAQLKLLARQ